MIDGRDPSPTSGGVDPSRYAGEFTYGMANSLTQEVSELGNAPAEEFFAVLGSAAEAQGRHGMAEAIERVSRTSEGTLLRGSYEPVVTSRINDKVNTQPAEQWAREFLAHGVGRTLADLYSLEHGENPGGKEPSSTTTIADLQVGAGLDKELFVAYARILAQSPESLESTPAVPEDITDVSQMSITREEATANAVMVEDQPDKIIRFQRTRIESAVPGYDFTMLRHGMAGYIKGDGTDMHKLLLTKRN